MLLLTFYAKMLKISSNSSLGPSGNLLLFTNTGKEKSERPHTTVQLVTTPTGGPSPPHKGLIVEHNGVTLSALNGLIPVSHCSKMLDALSKHEEFSSILKSTYETQFLCSFKS